MAETKGYYLKPADREAIAGLLAREARRADPTGGYLLDAEDGQAPSFYVAKTPTPGGLPGISGVNPGHADCDVYRLVPGLVPHLEQLPGEVSRIVYNLGTAIGKNKWMHVFRDAYGFWWPVAAPASGAGDVDPDTPEVPGACGGCGWAEGLVGEHCLFLSELYRGGSCACVDTYDDEVGPFTYSGTGNWQQTGTGAAWSDGTSLWQVALGDGTTHPTTSKQLQFLNPGGAFSPGVTGGLPLDATVTGLSFAFYGQDTSPGFPTVHTSISRVQLRRGTTLIGNNMAGTGVLLSEFVGALYAFGGEGNTWGLTAAELTAAMFDPATVVEIVYEGDGDPDTGGTQQDATLHAWFTAPIPPADRWKMETEDDNLWEVTELNQDNEPKTLVICGVEYLPRFYKNDPAAEGGGAALYLIPIPPEGGSGTGTGPALFKGRLNDCGLHWMTFSFSDPALCTNARTNAAGPLGNMICLEVRWAPCYKGGTGLGSCGAGLQPKTICFKWADALHGPPSVVIDDNRTYPNNYLWQPQWVSPETGSLQYAALGCYCPGFFGSCYVAPWLLEVFPTFALTPPPNTIGTGIGFSITPGALVGTPAFDTTVDDYLITLFSGGEPYAWMYAWNPETGCDVVPTDVRGPWDAYRIPRELYVHQPEVFAGDDPVLIHYNGGADWGYLSGTPHVSWTDDNEWFVWTPDGTASGGAVTNLEASYDPFLLEFDYDYGGVTGIKHFIISETT